MLRKNLIKAIGLSGLLLFSNAACSRGTHAGKVTPVMELSPLDTSINVANTNYTGLACVSIEDEKIESDPDNLTAIFHVIKSPQGAWELKIFAEVVALEGDIADMEDSFLDAVNNGQAIMFPSEETYRAVIVFKDPLRENELIKVEVYVDAFGAIHTTKLGELEDEFEIAISSDDISSKTEIPQPGDSKTKIELVSEQDEYTDVVLPFSKEQRLPNGWELTNSRSLLGTLDEASTLHREIAIITNGQFRCNTIQTISGSNLSI